MTELLQDRLHEITLHNRPNGNLKYEHQIDQIFLWMEDWNDDQVSRLYIYFLPGKSVSHFKFWISRQMYNRQMYIF